MTPKQQQTLDKLIKDIRAKHSEMFERIKDHGNYPRKDVKQLDIDDSDDLVFLIIEIGGRDDEKTMAEFFCRDHRHIMITKGGGCELLNPKKKGRAINRGIYHCVNNLTD